MTPPSHEQHYEHLAELRVHHLRRLRELEKTEALLGYATPAEIRLELADIRAKVEQLEQQLLTTTTTLVFASQAIENTTGNHLGHGIRLGGMYNGIALGLVTSPWARFRNTDVKSGWLYIEGEARMLAAAFFKIHLRTDGTGYIHILGASNPAHIVWFETDRITRIEQLFGWDASPGVKQTALWHFHWVVPAGHTE